MNSLPNFVNCFELMASRFAGVAQSQSPFLVLNSTLGGEIVVFEVFTGNMVIRFGGSRVLSPVCSSSRAAVFHRESIDIRARVLSIVFQTLCLRYFLNALLVFVDRP